MIKITKNKDGIIEQSFDEIVEQLRNDKGAFTEEFSNDLKEILLSKLGYNYNSKNGCYVHPQYVADCITLQNIQESNNSLTNLIKNGTITRYSIQKLEDRECDFTFDIPDREKIRTFDMKISLTSETFEKL